MLEWAALHVNDEYIIVKQEDVGSFWVSTVWIGLDMSGSYREPLIFETMVFQDDMQAVLQQRYATEEEAKKGHDQIVNDLKKSLEEIETLTNGSASDTSTPSQGTDRESD
jgi:hypothetical protein